MDLAYDHIQESALEPSASGNNQTSQPSTSANSNVNTLNSDFQEAYKAISSSPWGARLGGFFGSVVKQGESVYKEASQELSHVSQEATKGFTDLKSTLVSRTRSLSLAQKNGEGASAGESAEGKAEGEEKTKETQHAEGVLARLRSQAAKRLVEIQKAEDAADEALLKFGTNIRNFLADAVKVSPSTDADGQSGSTVLFESKDAAGKRVIHTTRFDAQLHVIHSSMDSFKKDPESEEWKGWMESFDVEKKTKDIAGDLDKYDELRKAMETLVPDVVAYKEFWTRYYFLRHSIETAEARRRDLLKGATADADEEDAGWGDDSDDEDEKKPAAAAASVPKDTASNASSQTLNQPAAGTLKPVDNRKPSSDDRSVADSEASYDLVGAKSGTASQAPGSPRAVDPKKAGDDSDDDWE